MELFISDSSNARTFLRL